MRKRVTSFVVLLLLLLNISGAAYAEIKPGNDLQKNDALKVLVLHSYHHGFAWTDSIMQGIQSVFDEKGIKAEMYIEYMDTKRNAPEKMFACLENLYGSKYKDVQFDVIISSDNNALDFLLKNGDLLFPGVPVVFSGINNYTEDLLAGHSNYTGVAEAIDMQGTIDLALKIHPNTERIITIADTTPTGVINRQKFDEIAHLYDEKYALTHLSDVTLAHLSNELADLPANTLILYFSFYKDQTGRPFSDQEIVPFITGVAQQPVYSLWDYTMGHGILGGVMVNGELQGVSAAQLATRILQGEPVKEISVVTQSPNTPMFDYTAMKRFNISRANLPEDSIIINQPVSFYSRYRPLVLLALLFIAFQSIAIVLLVGNIIRRKKAESALRHNEERYRMIFNHSPLGIIHFDQNGVLLDINPKFIEIMGSSKEALLGFNMLEALQDQDLLTTVKETMTQKSSIYHGDYLSVTGGKLTPVRATFTQITTNKGDFAGGVGIVEDMTEREKLEKQLRHAQKMEALGLLTGGIAHDFNNLLTAINGFAELIQRQLPEDSSAFKMAGNIMRSGKRAAKLVSQLLAFSRKQVMRPQILNLNTVVIDLYPMLRRIVNESVLLKTKLSGDLWAIEVDPSQIEQVIVNLVVNAGDAMPNGGQLIIETDNVTLDQKYTDDHPGAQAGPHILLAISDTGVGMNQEVQNHIFEPFFTTKDVGKGTGLGLATVFGIVKQSNGNIWVYSEEGVGTTFKVYLPQVAKSPDTPEKSADHSEMPSGTETILLVEDDENVRELTKRVLKQAGYKILVAHDGEQALDMAANYNNTIELLLTDVIMPGKSGTVVAKQLTAVNPALSVLFMSGYTDNAIAHHGVLESGVELLQKPFTPIELLSKVREVIDRNGDESTKDR